MRVQKNIIPVVFILIVIILSQFSTPQPVSAACSGIVYVSPIGTGAGGCSWANAYTTLQSALLDPTLANGNQIWVAAGTYYPDEGFGQTNNDRASTFTLVNGVSVYGGFSGTEGSLAQRDPAVNVTTLSGDIGTPGVDTDNAYSVVTALNINVATVLDGFNIQDGYENSGSDFGGGIYVSNSTAALQISGVTITDNFAGNGGGLAAFESNLTLSRVIFTNNIARQYGGGLYNQNGSPTLVDVVFDNNQTQQPASPGGGIHSTNSDSSLYTVAPSLTRVTFSNNRALQGGGGGMFNFESHAILTNVTFSGNTAFVRGGAMLNEGSNPVLNNVTISGNTAPAGTGGAIRNIYALGVTPSNPVIRNTILWGNGSEEIINDAGSGVTINDSIVQSGCPALGTCSNIITTNPNLGGLANNGGFTQTRAIGLGSSALNAGNNATCAATDQREFSRPRTLADLCDIGAFEFGGTGTITTAGNASATYGSTSVNLTATVSPNPGGGTVQFYIDGNLVGSSSVNAGTGIATLTYDPSGLNGGAHTIRADYSGFGSYLSSTSNPTNNGTLTINPAVLTVTANPKSRVYGTANPTFDAAITGFVNGETLITSDVTGTPSCTTTATPTSPVSGSPYAITCTLGTLASTNYSFTFAAGDLAITQATLTITADNRTKNYGDTVTFAGTEFTTTGLIGTDTVTSMTLTSAGAASNATVAGSPYAIVPSAAVGTGLGNYTINYANGSLTVNGISVVPTITADDKAYDGTTAATFTCALSGVVTGDIVNCSGGTATFADKHVGNNKTVTVTGLTLSGANSANYTLSTTTDTDTANITARAITVTAVTDTKIYDGNTASAGTPTTSIALATGDTATWTQTFDTKHVGINKTLTPAGTINDGNGGANYTVTLVNNTTGVITTRPITVTAVTDTKAYDGTTASSGTPTVTIGSVTGTDTATWTQTFDTPFVGIGKTLTPAGAVNDGNSGNNYAITFAPVNTGTITGTPLDVTINQSGAQPDPTNASPINFTVVFSASVNNFVSGDVNLSGTAVGVGTTATVTGSGNTYNIAVSNMIGDGTVIVDIPGAVASDTAGNLNNPSTTTDDTVTYDTTVPTVTIDQAVGQTDPTNASPINFTVTFSEAVNNFVTSDVSFTGSTVGGTLVGTVSGGPTVYNVAVTGMTGSGDVVLSIGAGVASDTAGNGNSTATILDNTVTFDGTGPTVIINQAAGQADPTGTSPINFTVTFNEAVSNFATGDISFTGSTVGGTLVGTVSGGPTVYNVAVTGMTGNGTVIASILAGVASDALGNGNTQSTSTDNTVTFDGTGPTVIIDQAGTQADPTSASPINFTVTFSEAVSNFATGDVSFTGSTATGTLVGTVSGGPTVYNVAVTGMTGSGDVVASIAGGVASDALGNGNAPSTSTDNTVTFDSAAPTVTIDQAVGQVDPTNTSPINFTVTFSEAVNNFAAGDVSFTGSTAAGTLVGTVSGGPTVYNVAVTGMTGNGTIVATVNAGVATDSAGNGNTTAGIIDNTVTFDTTGPVVTIGTPTPASTVLGPVDFAVTITGATAVNFVDTDVTLTTTGTAAAATITVTNGGTNNPTVTLSGISGSGTIRISIAAGIASDATGNNSLAAGPSTPVTIDNAGPVVLFNSNTVPTDGATLQGGPTQLKVAFNENVKNDGSAGAANNTVNYLLVGSGPDLVLDTNTSCTAGVQGDDVPFIINSASYAANSGSGPFVATLGINGGTPLPVGTYHLLVCGTTSIEDLTNNELNDGAADTVIDFRVVQATASIPKTGFAMNTVTNLPIQPEGLAYTSTDMWMEIPSLGVKTSIVGVTKTSVGWDVTWLDRSAGWLDGSAYPTWKGNSVITAHVWDALNKPGPFARLKELKHGDQVKIHAFGQIYTYEVRETTTLSPTNATTMLKHQDKTWITLVTCEGFQELTKDYSSRRMVRAVLVSVTAEK